NDERRLLERTPARLSNRPGSTAQRLPVLADRTDLDRTTEPCSWDLRREFDRGRLVIGLEDVHAASRGTRPTNGPVRRDGLPVLHPHGGRILRVAEWNVLLKPGRGGDLGVLLSDLRLLGLGRTLGPPKPVDPRPVLVNQDGELHDDLLV